MKEFIYKKYQSSLFLKNFLKIICFIFFIFFVGVIFVYQSSISGLNNEFLQSNYTNTENVANISDTIFKEVKMLASNLSNNNNIHMYLMSDDKENHFSDLNSAVINQLSSFSLIYEYIDSIYVYSG